MTLSNVRSSLPLEILLHANSRFSVFFYVGVIGIYFYKLSYFNYPIHVEVTELAILFLFAPIELLRIGWAHRGNLTETPVYIIFSLALSVGVFAICMHLALFQGYVLMVERIAAALEGAFVVFEAVFEFAAIASFSRSVSPAK